MHMNPGSNSLNGHLRSTIMFKLKNNSTQELLFWERSKHFLQYPVMNLTLPSLSVGTAQCSH